jgi:hypothetical protein
MIRKITEAILDLQRHGFVSSEILDIVEAFYDISIYLFKQSMNIDVYEFFEHNDKVCKIINRLRNYGYFDGEIITLFNTFRDAFKRFKLEDVKELIEVVGNLKE